MALVAGGQRQDDLRAPVPRFYDPTGGEITIDGIDIREATLESLRRNIGIVQQDVFIHTATIAENIAYGRGDASEGDIREVASVAQLHEFISGLPDQYDTIVGERGGAVGWRSSGSPLPAPS